jgi:UDP-N-acetylmuramate dehydrogenase
LIRGGRPKIAYSDIREYFGQHQPTLKETRDAVLAIRRSKSMVIDPNDANRRSAGSFFKNPIVTRQRFDEIAGNFESVPHFLANDGLVKIPAAWLIERSGFAKGFIHGNAGISSNHTLAIINRGGATADEIISLKSDIQSAVESRFGIRLQPEPVFVGSFEK